MALELWHSQPRLGPALGGVWGGGGLALLPQVRPEIADNPYPINGALFSGPNRG